jgi:hypothetical protein
MFAHETSEVTGMEKIRSQKRLKFTSIKHSYCYSYQVKANVRDGTSESHPRFVEYIQKFSQKTKKD